MTFLRHIVPVCTVLCCVFTVCTVHESFLYVQYMYRLYLHTECDTMTIHNYFYIMHVCICMHTWPWGGCSVSLAQLTSSRLAKVQKSTYFGGYFWSGHKNIAIYTFFSTIAPKKRHFRKLVQRFTRLDNFPSSLGSSPHSQPHLCMHYA